VQHQPGRDAFVEPGRVDPAGRDGAAIAGHRRRQLPQGRTPADGRRREEGRDDRAPRRARSRSPSRRPGPARAENFVDLAACGFYDGTVFHRVVKDFVIQGGDPTGTGSGGPGYEFKDDPVSVPYTRGTVAMANAGANTNGSQFFIVLKDIPEGGLPPAYSVFGHVTKGMERSTRSPRPPTAENPTSPIKMDKVTVAP
jgi:cyclophilin family peptidyl-prolyl cis-trans isomerase